MEVSRSGYYIYLKNKAKKLGLNIKIISELKILHRISNRSYGSRRMAKAISAQGYKVGRYKIRRLMQENGISCKQRRRYTVTTQSKHDLKTAKNVLNRNFSVKKPNSAWVADITYLWTNEGWLYLAAVLDLFSRKVVGWSMSDNMQANLVERAFTMATSSRRPLSGFLHHSDRGIQYASKQYQQVLKRSGAIVSMSRKGNCWDNAVMERFFGTLKSERTDNKRYVTRAEAKTDVAHFIEIFYNNQRLHSTLNYMSPVQYEINFDIQNGKRT